MNAQTLHALLVRRFGLVPDDIRRGNCRTYFLRAVQRHPANSTRIARVLFAPDGEAFGLQLCASSDNNDTVLLRQPFDEAGLAVVIRDEIALVERRLVKAAPA